MTRCSSCNSEATREISVAQNIWGGFVAHIGL